MKGLKKKTCLRFRTKYVVKEYLNTKATSDFHRFVIRFLVTHCFSNLHTYCSKFIVIVSITYV